MSKAYQPPEWSSLPIYQFSLEVIKEGTIIASIDLNEREYYVVGRQPDVCHIELEHPSISRQHAVLQHSSTGMKLLDWNSAQGTFINKMRVESGVYIDLNVGDVIKFAASSRLYVVCGPEDLKPPEYDSENIRKLREKSELRQESALKVADEGISWGMADDVGEAETEDDEEGDESKKNLPDYVKFDENYDRKYGAKFESRLNLNDGKEYSERDKGVLEKIRKKERKIQNMQEENRRIFLKESSLENGLTEGQLAAVNRNDTRIQVLQEEITQLENELMAKSSSRSSESSSVKQRASVIEEEGCLDTTLQSADVSTNWRLRRRVATTTARPSVMPSKALSFEELTALHRKEALRAEELRTRLASVNDSMNAFSSRRQGEPSIVDEIEGAVALAQFEENKNELPSLLEKISAAEAQMAWYEKLIRVAAPALESLVHHNKDGLGVTDKLPAASKLNDHSNSQASTAIIPTVTPETTLKNKTQNRLEGLANFLGTGVENTTDLGKDSTPESRPRPLRTQTEGEVSRTAKKARIIGPLAPTEIKGSAPKSRTLEGGDVVWVPPNNQVGDGRTALNEKLGY